MQGAETTEPGTAAETATARGTVTPVRGTQSFVGVMAQVWKRPSLTLLEVLWRWCFGGVVIGLAAWLWGPRLWQSIQPFLIDPGFNSATTAELWLREHNASRIYGITRHGLLLTVLACAVWAIVSAAGRSIVLQRLAPEWRQNLFALVEISFLRVFSLVVTVALWFAGFSALADHMVLRPLFQQHDPALVPFAAAVIFGTLLLFVLWMAASYVFHLAPVISVAHRSSALRSLGAALNAEKLRGKLIEVNLVLGIVKIILLVLAMVFSACPLPFSSVETQTFLAWWWAAVAVWYLLASDFFHVVRTAAFLSLWRAYEMPQLGPRRRFGNLHRKLQALGQNKLYRESIMSFGLYLLGTIVLIIGVLYVCSLAHISQHWMFAIAIVLLGAGIMGAVSSTRRKDPS